MVVSAQTIEESIEWINEWNNEYVKESPDTLTCESVMLAFKDKTVILKCQIISIRIHRIHYYVLDRSNLSD